MGGTNTRAGKLRSSFKGSDTNPNGSACCVGAMRTVSNRGPFCQCLLRRVATCETCSTAAREHTLHDTGIHMKM
jgi:hypothetical protein